MLALSTYRRAFIAGLLIFGWVFWMVPAHAEREVQIGIVTDGNAEIMQRAQALFVGEILQLTAGEFDIVVEESRVLNGNWSVDGVNAALDQLYAEPEIDIVLALGFVSSIVAARQDSHPKPTFAPMVLDSNLVNLPRESDTSGVKNLNYLTEEVRFADDVQAFQEIVSFKRLSMLLEKSIYDAVPDLAARGIEWAAELGIELDYVLQESTGQDLVAMIPENTDAIMLAALPRLDQSERSKLIQGLIDRGLPSYSLIGTTPVVHGILAATAPDSDWQRLARRNALNIQSVLLGENAGDQRVSFRHKRKLTINMDTARKLEISPRFDVLSTATLLNEDILQGSRTWSLPTVAVEARVANLDIQAGMAGVAAGAELKTQATSLLRPQFNTSLGVTQLNDDTPAVLAGQSAERTGQLQLSASQVIYSESALASIQVAHHEQQARVAAQRALELDTIQSASVGFLQVLKAQTAVNIRSRALELSRTNLDLARDRVQLGSSNASDVFRWESEVASSRQALLQARAEREQAMDNLNRLLHRPITERFSTAPASLDDPSLLVSRNDLVDLIDNQRALNAMGEIFVAEGFVNAPELRQLAANIAATERRLESGRKSYWSPEVSLSGQISQTLYEHEELMNSMEGETDWQIGLNVTLPIHQGGRRRSEINQSVYALHQLELQRLATRDRIEQNVRANLHAVQASFASIDLAARAAQAARKNLELVQDNYSSGTASIITYLDARDAFLNADQNATDAVYNFLIDLMNLQRASGAFDFFLDAASMDAMADRIRQKVINGY